MTDENADSIAKKKFICEYGRQLDKADKKDIIKLIKRKGHRDKFKTNAMTSEINIDVLEKIDPSIINDLYSQIKHKISKKELA